MIKATLDNIDGLSDNDREVMHYSIINLMSSGLAEEPAIRITLDVFYAGVSHQRGKDNE